MYTAKQAIMLKEHDPSVQTYVFYMDLRAGGRYYDEFTRRAQETFAPGTCAVASVASIRRASATSCRAMTR